MISVDSYSYIIPQLLQGAWVTLTIAACSSLIGFVGGTLLGIAQANGSKPVRIAVATYATIIRGTPLLLQIMFFFLVLSSFGLNISALSTAILAIGINSSAYISQIVRSGISSVSRGQIEAARTLGVSSFDITRYIVLPQALRVVVPAPVSYTHLMFRFSKLLIFLAIATACSYVSWRTYNYFFLISTPTLELVGIAPEGSYAGNVTAAVKGHDDYKVARLTLKIDGKPLIDNVKIGRRTFEYPFTLPAETLAAGKHTIDIEVENGAYNRRKTAQSLVFYVDNSPLQAGFVKNEADAKVAQGRTLHVQFQTNKELKEAHLKTLSKSYPCFRESERSLIYECYVPVDTEEVPNEYLMTIEALDPVGNKITLEGKFQVVSFAFKKQTLKIEAEKMKAENEAGASEKQFETEIEELTKKSPQKKLWHGTFVTPIEVKDPKQITTEYGVIRATQERGLRQHKALDLYTTPKSVIWAPQDGIVVMKSRFAHSGNTVVIDHGWGILSMFFHLDTFANIELGEKIKKGNPVGTLGKTGYATGYHLHWEMRVGNVAIDPMEWTKASF